MLRKLFTINQIFRLLDNVKRIESFPILGLIIKVVKFVLLALGLLFLYCIVEFL